MLKRLLATTILCGPLTTAAQADILQPAVITANAIFVWIVEGFCLGLGLALAWYLVGMPFRRWGYGPPA